jgi:hypothetical protein
MTAAKEPKRPRAARRACGSRQAVVSQATSEARRRAAAVLEVLAGVRTPAQAAQALAVSLPRYYQLEQRAIGGLVSACEPAPRGLQPSAERRVAALEREVVRLTREAGRQQALARAAQRTLALAPPVAPKPNGKVVEKGGPPGKSRRRRRPTVRALTLAKALAAEGSGNSSGVSSPTDVEQSLPPGK